jgi:hypothetical protein
LRHAGACRGASTSRRRGGRQGGGVTPRRARSGDTPHHACSGVTPRRARRRPSSAALWGRRARGRNPGERGEAERGHQSRCVAQESTQKGGGHPGARPWHPAAPLPRAGGVVRPWLQPPPLPAPRRCPHLQHQHPGGLVAADPSVPGLGETKHARLSVPQVGGDLRCGRGRRRRRGGAGWGQGGVGRGGVGWGGVGWGGVGRGGVCGDVWRGPGIGAARRRRRREPSRLDTRRARLVARQPRGRPAVRGGAGEGCRGQAQ